MALDLNETATLTLRGEMNEFDRDLGELDMKAKELRKTLKEIETTGPGKGSDEWKALKTELANVTAESSKLKRELDLNTATYGQLRNAVKQYASDLKTLVPGTEEFVNATKKLQDVKARYAEVQKQVNGVKEESEKLAEPGMWSKISAGVNSMATAFKSFIVLEAFGYIVQGFRAIVGSFTEFEDAAQSLSAVTGLTGKDLEYMKDEAKKTGPQFGMTAAEMLKAYELMGSAKPELLAQKEALAAVTKEAVVLAKAGKIDLAEAAKVVGESLNQFGKGAESANRFVNVMAASVKEGSDEIGGISSALKSAGTVANSAGLSFEKTNAVLASLSTIALKGEQAGTMLRNVLIKLQTGADEFNPKVVGLDKALDNLGKRHLSTAELAKMFGLENIVAAQHIIKNREEIATLTTKLTGTSEAYTQAAKNQDSLSSSTKTATAIVTGYAVAIGEKLAPYIKQAINWFIEATRNTDVFGGVIDALTGYVNDLITVFRIIVTTIFPNFNTEGTTMREIMQGIAVWIQTALIPLRLFAAALAALYEGFQMVGSGISAVSQFISAVFGVVVDKLTDSFLGLISPVTDLFGWLKTMVNSVFPNFNAVSSVTRTIMNSLGEVFQWVMIPVRIFMTAISALIEGFTGMGLSAKIFTAFMTGDFAGAQKAFEETKQHGTNMMNTFKTAFTQIADGYKKALVDKPKELNKDIVDTNKKNTSDSENVITEEQGKGLDKRDKEKERLRKKAEADEKKYLEDVNKANAKALEDLSKIEEERHINSIKNEETRELVKLAAKRDRDVEAVMKTLASEENKNAQIKELDAKLTEDQAAIHQKFQEKKTKAEEEQAAKRLEVLKNVARLEQDAENALFDWKELMARGNATKLSAIAKERADTTLRITKERLDAEQAAEEAKARKEITDGELQGKALEAIGKKYDAERLLAEAKNAEERAKIEADLKKKKEEVWNNAAGAFKAFLKGDFDAFSEHVRALGSGEQTAWQKSIDGEKAKFAAIASAAIAAVDFLNELAQRKAERAIAEAKKERDAKVAILDEQMAKEKDEVDKLEAEKQRIKQASDDKIEAIREQTESSISDLEQQYRTLSSSQEKAKLDSQIAAYEQAADTKKQEANEAAQEAIEAAQLESQEAITAIKKRESETIRAAESEKNERIDNAEAARDAEIDAIKKRADIDSSTREKLLAEATKKFEDEKKMATDEATHKIDQAKLTAKTASELATDEAKLKIKLAKDRQEAELKAIEAVQKGDKKAAEEILKTAQANAKEQIALAKDEATKKIDEAEREKREKLKKVESEKQIRIQNQKELNRSIESENAAAAQKEADAKRKAWEAQKRADQARALMQGAMAVLSALATPPFPVGLVMAVVAGAMTAIQIAKIRSQPTPQFRHGGFVPEGPRHGTSYGSGGLAITRRDNGQEVGEMEGDEAIISREQTRANWPVISRMFDNARTPSRRHMPVFRDSMGRRAFQAGGLLEPLQYGEMYLFGSKKKKEAEKAAAEAQREADAAAREAEADAAAASASGGGGDYGSADYGGGGSDVEGMGDAMAAHEEASRMAEEQLKLLGEIKDEVKASGQELLVGLANLRSGMVDALGANATATGQGLAALESAVSADLADLKAGVLAGLDLVSDTVQQSSDTQTNALTLALQNLSQAQNRDLDELTSTLRAGLVALGINQEIGNMNLTTALTTQLTQTRNDLTTALQNGSAAELRSLETLQSALLLKLAEVNAGLTSTLNQNSQAERLSMALNNLNLLQRLAEVNTGLTQTLNQNSQAERQAGALQTMAVLNSLRDLNEELKNGLSDNGLKTQQALATLNTTTRTSLQALAVSSSQSNTLLGDRTTTALATLDTHTTTALSTLLTQVVAKLTALQTGVTSALDSTATRTVAATNTQTAAVNTLGGRLDTINVSTRAVEGAAERTKNAVYETNQAGRLDALISAISNLG